MGLTWRSYPKAEKQPSIDVFRRADTPEKPNTHDVLRLQVRLLPGDQVRLLPAASFLIVDHGFEILGDGSFPLDINPRVALGHLLITMAHVGPDGESIMA